MIKTTLIAATLSSNILLANAECANGCNGHGRCTSYDMCDCNRNWQANDCSERVCQYGLAHVDTPKGDLDMDNQIKGPDLILIENSFKYPYGTTEQFPRMQDSDLLPTPNSAHYYMECSNKGSCNRNTGLCECFPGYDGVACQRASCPGYPQSCSGHGVCKTIRQLANADNGNVYELWDRDSTMGCECDAGFFGPDCSQRACKSSIDPLYYDDIATTKTAVFDFAILISGSGATLRADDDQATFGTQDAVNQGLAGFDFPKGKWSIIYYDLFGEAWETRPIGEDASCAEVVAALLELPNNVIPSMDVNDCTKLQKLTQHDALLSSSTGWTVADDNYQVTPGGRARPIDYKLAFWLPGQSAVNRPSSYYDTNENDYAGTIYRIHFRNTPGAIKQPEINVHLDGPRPTLSSSRLQTYDTITAVWTDGQQGESIDYFADHCDGVVATIDATNPIHILTLTPAHQLLLKACLGTSDFDDTNNEDIYEWDFGDRDYPHLVKLVLTTTSREDGGHYVAIYWDDANDEFVMVNPMLEQDGQTGLGTNLYEVYTTKGVLARTSQKSEAYFPFGSRKIVTGNTSWEITRTNNRPDVQYDGDLSCENHAGPNDEYVTHCLNKSDIFTFLSFDALAKNPPHINLYTVNKIYTTPFSSDISTGDLFTFDGPNKVALQASGQNQHFGTHVIETDLSTNWAVADAIDTPDDGQKRADAATFQIYKFFPDPSSSYTYVSQCSNRGICNNDDGLCQCFKGYTGDACQIQSSLVV